jgi:hypothetical protein
VRAALASDRPPKYERSSPGSFVDAVETDVRKLLADFPRMPATVIAERIGWEYSITTLKDRIRQIRPEYAGVDPADRIIYRPGEIVQCDLWLPEPRIPVGHGQNLMLPVLVMTLGFSRFLTATMLPSRQAGDLLAGMWQLINALGKVPKTLIWDRESAIGGKGVVTVPEAMTALPPVPPTTGLRTRIRLARDYYVRLDSNDYSVDPRAIGRFVDVHATATMVTVTYHGDVAAVHERYWAKRAVITDPAHVAGAKTLRSAFAQERQARERATRHHADGRQVTLRALTDYDVLFSSDFTAAGAKVTS